MPALDLIEPVKGFVLHSGGLDSSTALAIAIQIHGVSNVTSVGVDYGQRHIKEMQKASELCGYLGVRRICVRLPEQPSSMLTDPQVSIPEVSYEEISGVSPTYVPFRNGQLISTIVAIAHAEVKDTGVGAAVYLGNHAEDAFNSAYPDCSLEFAGAMASAVLVGTYGEVRLRTPLQWMTKADIVRKGTELGLDFSKTWSCYKGGEKHCGLCPTCRARKKAFEVAGVEDPTEYEV